MIYPKVNILHTLERQDRLDNLMNEFKVQGITDYTVWFGKEIVNFRAKGINISHKRIVQNAMDNNLPEVLIMENDCQFFAPGAFDYYIKNKPESYDLYLGNVFHGLNPDEQTTNDFFGLTMYMVHSRFYKLFLSVREEDNIDRALAKYNFAPEIRNLLEYKVCNPMVCTQRAGFSDHKQRYDSYDRYLQGKKLFSN